MSVIDMENHCRLCSSNDAILYNLFDEEGMYLHYVKKIHKLLPIAINEFDPMPNTICHRCAFKISEFYEFRLNCLKTQEHFKLQLPWWKPNQRHDTSSDHIPMVELNMKPVEDYSSGERLQTANKLSNYNDNHVVVIDDDDNDDDDDDVCSKEGASTVVEYTPELPKNESSTFEVEGQDNSHRLVMKIKKKTSVRKPPVWDAKNSNHFGKRRRRKNKSCKIDQIFSTSSSLYHSLGQIDVIDPTKFITAQDKGNSTNNVKTKHKKSINVQPNDKPALKLAIDVNGSDNESRLPNCILVTKIPNVGYAYTCRICRRTFLGAESAVTHDCIGGVEQTKKPIPEPEPVSQKVNNNDAEDVYVCDMCNKVFPRQVMLLAHKKQHFLVYSSTESEEEQPSKSKRRIKRNKLDLDEQKNYNNEVSQQIMDYSEL